MLQVIRCLPKRYFQLDLPILLVNWKSSQYCEIALLFSFLENIRHMGKETNSFTLIVVSGPLAQSAERGADNAKVVSSTLTRTSMQKYSSPFFVSAFFCLFMCLFVFSFAALFYVHRW